MSVSKEMKVHGRMQEDVAWSRLLDMQREWENERLYGSGTHGWPAVRKLAQRAWVLAGLAQGRAPRRRPAAAARKTAL